MKKISRAKIYTVAISIVVVMILLGFYLIKTREGEEHNGESLITKNVGELGLNFGDIKEYIENVKSYTSNYTGNVEARANWREEGLSKEKLQEAGFKQGYYIFSVDLENLENIQIPRISVYSNLDEYSSVTGADKIYESVYKGMRELWEEYNLDDPEEKAIQKYKAIVSEEAEKVIEDGKFAFFDESFARFYENISGTPGYGITFRERNIFGEIFVNGDIPRLSEKVVSLAAILDNRLQTP